MYPRTRAQQFEKVCGSIRRSLQFGAAARNTPGKWQQRAWRPISGQTRGSGPIQLSSTILYHRSLNLTILDHRVGLLFGVNSTKVASTDAETGDKAMPGKKRQTSYRGHPPFKRNTSGAEETAPPASFEEVDKPAEREPTPSFRGHPPFKRRANEPGEQADSARCEETGERVKKRRPRRGPVGKWNSRR